MEQPQPTAAPPTTARDPRGPGASALRRPLRRRRWKTLVWIVVLLALAGGAALLLQRPRTPTVSVRTHLVGRGDVRELVSSVAAGRVTSRREAVLRAEIAARVAELRCRRGEKVAKGQVLVTYDTAELADRVKVAQAALALARAQVGQAEATAALAQQTARRAAALHSAGASSAAEAETLAGQATAAQAAVHSAQAAVTQAAANLELARTALGKTAVRAPYDATILTTQLEEGETAAPGAPLLSLADMTDLYVDAEIDEVDLGRVRVGVPAEVSLDAFPDERLVGTLVEIAPSITIDPRGGRNVAVRVELAADPRLRVGMSAEVDLVVSTRRNVLWVPANSVSGRGANRSVFVVQRQVAHKRSVEVGVSTWEAVEVTKGLAAGDQVIVTLGAADLADGVRVRARAESTRTSSPAEASR